MKKIRFELTEDDNIYHNSQHVILETSLGGDTLEDYVQAFKAFLIACTFTEDLVKEVTTREQAIMDWQEENKNCHLTDDE